MPPSALFADAIREYVRRLGDEHLAVLAGRLDREEEEQLVAQARAGGASR